jgi:transcriptional regulator with XRE-family HTH domain
MTGAQVRMLRERCRLSLRGLARVIKVSHITIWRWETGRHAIPPRLAIMLALMAHHVRPPVRPCPHCGGTGVQRPET